MSLLLQISVSQYELLSKKIQGLLFQIRSHLKVSLFWIIILMPCNSPLLAGMQDSLEKAFSVLGMANNITEGGGYQDQTGGFYTGGSVFARSKAMNTELFSLQMPHYRAGCGGIDLFMGGISFISVGEFTQLLRNIGVKASGYAFSLALATVTPQIKSVLDRLAATVQEMTLQSINSCEAAATLTGAVWPQSEISSQHLCNAIGNSYGQVSDWVQSRQKCGAKGEREATNAQKNNASGFQDMLGDEFNVAWKAIQKNAFLSSDRDLAEFFMTISGTIVSQKTHHPGQDKPPTQVKYYPSKSSDTDLLMTLIEGKKPAQIYRCDNHEPDKCLNLQLSKPIALGNKALSQKVRSMLDSIKAKLWADTKPLSPEEQSFVNSTMIPILKIMAVEMAFKQGSPITVTSYQEAIAHDILLQYLGEVMELVWTSVVQLKQVQINGDMLEEFRAGIASARKHLFAERTKMFEQISLTLEAIERTHQIEVKLQQMFVSQQQGTRQ